MTVAWTYFAFTVDDVGDAIGSPADLREILRFLARWEVRATLFVVPAPGGKPITTAPEWCEVLSEAKALGHDLELHGLAASLALARIQKERRFLSEMFAGSAIATYSARRVMAGGKRILTWRFWR